jgi:hypothetical protein
MNVVKTCAPIPIEELKKYFADKETFYLINYADSELKGEKLLTYLGNLDIPCDIRFENAEDLKELVSVYLKSTFIVNLPILEDSVIKLLLANEGFESDLSEEFKSYADEVKEDLNEWAKRIKSGGLFNLYCSGVDELKEQIEQHPLRDDTDSLVGVNWINLFKYDVVNYIMTNSTFNETIYYPKYFNDYMFKGNNLYHYFANKENSLHILTWAIGAGVYEEYKNELSENQEN